MAAHPDRARHTRHTRHLIKELLKTRATTRASVLLTQTSQLQHSVTGTRAPVARVPAGVRVGVGPEHHSLLRQLQASRDARVHRQIVAEIAHHARVRVAAAIRRMHYLETARQYAKRGAVGLWNWLRARPKWARDFAAARSRTTRTVGGRAPQRRTRSLLPADSLPSSRFGRPARKRASRFGRKRSPLSQPGR